MGAAGNLLAEAGCSRFFILSEKNGVFMGRARAKKKTTKASPFHEDVTFVVFFSVYEQPLPKQRRLRKKQTCYLFM